MSVIDAIKTPLGVILLLVLLVVFAGITAFSALSGAFTNAAIGGAGLLSIVILLFVINAIGK